MTHRKSPEAWLKEAQQVFDQMAAFNSSHPHATWAETEAAVDGALSGLRRDMLAASVQDHALADFRDAKERPSCSHCGSPLHANGQVIRKVLTQGDEVVEVERTRGRCPACGAGIFPPG